MTEFLAGVRGQEGGGRSRISRPGEHGELGLDGPVPLQPCAKLGAACATNFNVNEVVNERRLAPA
jgi:hypothetical protein